MPATAPISARKLKPGGNAPWVMAHVYGSRPPVTASGRASGSPDFHVASVARAPKAATPDMPSPPGNGEPSIGVNVPEASSMRNAERLPSTWFAVYTWRPSRDTATPWGLRPVGTPAPIAFTAPDAPMRYALRRSSAEVV